jgi:hypothetical protein
VLVLACPCSGEPVIHFLGILLQVSCLAELLLATNNLNKPITITKSTFKKYEASHFFPMI